VIVPALCGLAIILAGARLDCGCIRINIFCGHFIFIVAAEVHHSDHFCVLALQSTSGLAGLGQGRDHALGVLQFGEQPIHNPSSFCGGYLRKTFLDLFHARSRCLAFL
jgi:hypothetical protein